MKICAITRKIHHKQTFHKKYFTGETVTVPSLGPHHLERHMGRGGTVTHGFLSSASNFNYQIRASVALWVVQSALDTVAKRIT